MPCARSSSGIRFGTPASTAGRKNEFATPATAASATIASALPTNGSATKTPMRAMSAATISFLRESRSMSGPAASPTITDGRKVTMKRALTHHVESVRSLTSTVSAIVAIHVPTPEPRVARKSRRKLGAVRSILIWRLSRGCKGDQAGCSTRASATARWSSSSGVPTETRIAVVDPKPVRGRTMIPSCSSCS